MSLAVQRDVAPGAAGAAGLPIRLAGVSKSFGETEVLRRFDLHIPAGQFVAVVGRSGGGKSTLLRLVSGLDQPSGGRVMIGERAVTSLDPAVRLLFQEARLVPWQRVVENVGIARGENWRERALQALRDVGLDGRGDEWPSVLSGGQRQRVALARALVSRPNILLLDEPFGALDALTRIEMHRLLDGIWRERGFTTVLITHDVAEAVALADRVIVLREGRVALDLPVDLEHPRAELADPRAAELQKQILAAV
ncbi:ATP-binding cassette domain-containing protein [Mesorhizobium sp. RP14(2022)]|uniref:ATP-binding cassette domain-containing protein n=1 Tax=Mesorhizobium liriopis TaxID=2953882 RepID=A0ABT1CAL7_9HYPH|nr:ATP-binding cassette domain-containing protein [Mesorhizobium liriopis]MCO6051874.1 ATP-binding cassette domain-containing protein [Mesorhizobium liriopis]